MLTWLLFPSTNPHQLGQPFYTNAMSGYGVYIFPENEVMPSGSGGIDKILMDYLNNQKLNERRNKILNYIIKGATRALTSLIIPPIFKIDKPILTLIEEYFSIFFEDYWAC